MNILSLFVQQNYYLSSFKIESIFCSKRKKLAINCTCLSAVDTKQHTQQKSQELCPRRVQTPDCISQTFFFFREKVEKMYKM